MINFTIVNICSNRIVFNGENGDDMEIYDMDMEMEMADSKEKKIKQCF